MAAVQQPDEFQQERGITEDILLATVRLLLANQEVDVNIQEPVSVHVKDLWCKCGHISLSRHSSELC